MINSDNLKYIQILWDFMRMDQTVEKSDCMVVLGCSDIKVVNIAIELYKKGLADKVIFTGGYGKITKNIWNIPEADKFAEIAIDEYQDSNLVQEYILNSISNGNNIFMVGDVKQSIYKFRQARPELFLEKYATYQLKEKKQEENGLKIQLFKNFRSRENVLEITNLVFEDIMSHKLGDVEYTKEEYLNYGANYPEPEESLRR